MVGHYILYTHIILQLTFYYFTLEKAINKRFFHFYFPAVEYSIERVYKESLCQYPTDKHLHSQSLAIMNTDAKKIPPLQVIYMCMNLSL